MKTMFLLLAFLGIALAAGAQSANDSFTLYFATARYNLDDAAKAHLDSLVYLQQLRSDQQLRITGYADYVGGDGYNDTLSLRRAAAVSSYLQELGLPAEKIALVAGRGKIERSGMTDKQGHAPDRRVDILVNPHLRVNLAPVVVAEPAAATRTPTPPREGIRIDLSSVEENETLPLRNIYFFPGRHILRDSSYAALEELVVALKENPEVVIRIEGHICCYTRGSDALDEDTMEPKLSFNRAKYIFQYLVSKGIARERMQYIGFGRSKPLVAIEQSEEDSNQNRRVEIRILKK